MKLLLALASVFIAVFLALPFLAIGVQPLISGADSVESRKIDEIVRGDLPLSEHLEVTDGVLTLGRERVVHLVGGDMFVPVLSPGAAGAATAGGGFDLAAARAVDGGQRTVVARIDADDLREWLLTAGVASDRRVLGPFDVKGRAGSLSVWPDEIQTLLTDELGIPEDQILALAHGQAPLGRGFGVTVLVIGGLLLLGARKLWRWRLRFGAPRSSLTRRLLSARVVPRPRAVLGSASLVAVRCWAASPAAPS